MHWVSNIVVMLLIAGTVGAARHAGRDRFWPRAVVSYLALALVLTIVSVQLVSPTRRWRPHLPGPVRALGRPLRVVGRPLRVFARPARAVARPFGAVARPAVSLIRRRRRRDQGS